MGRLLASWLLAAALLCAPTRLLADEPAAEAPADPAAVAAAGLRAAFAGDADALEGLADWAAVRATLLGADAERPDVGVAEVRRTVLAWHRHAKDPARAAAVQAADATVETSGEEATVSFPAPVEATVACRRTGDAWRLAGWSSLPRTLFRATDDARVREHLAFQRACTQLPPVGPEGAFELDAEILLHGLPIGSLWVAVQPVREGERDLWRIQETLRIGGVREVRREGFFSATLYPVRGLRRARQAGAEDEQVSRWRGDGETLVVEQGEGEAREPALQAPFGGTALIGAGPVLLLARHLAGAPRALLGSALYDEGDGPLELAACRLRVEARGDDPANAGTTLVVEGRATARIALVGGQFRSAAYEYAPFTFAVRPRGSTPDEIVADLWTREPTTARLAAAQFVHAIQQWRVARAQELVAWERVLPADLPDADKAAYSRAWLEKTRLQLRRALGALPADTVLRAVHAGLRVTRDGDERARVVLPSPYVGWALELVRTGAQWKIVDAVYARTTDATR